MAANSYASRTKVTKNDTIGDLETILGKHGATSFIAGTHEGDATIAFHVAGLNILMRVPLPKITERRFTHSETGRTRSPDKIRDEHQTAIRATWRALLLFVKAKLVAVDQGLTTIEQEFLPHILLPGGTTLAETALPAIREAYATGQIPPLLPGPTRPAIGGRQP
jgi:hypothetical protein